MLEDAANQVVISPPLAKRPKIALKNKIVTIDLPESEVLHSEYDLHDQFRKSR